MQEIILITENGLKKMLIDEKGDIISITDVEYQ